MPMLVIFRMRFGHFGIALYPGPEFTSGFSHRTCLSASKAAMAISACRPGGSLIRPDPAKTGRTLPATSLGRRSQGRLCLAESLLGILNPPRLQASLAGQHRGTAQQVDSTPQSQRLVG